MLSRCYFMGEANCEFWMVLSANFRSVKSNDLWGIIAPFPSLITCYKPKAFCLLDDKGKKWFELVGTRQGCTGSRGFFTSPPGLRSTLDNSLSVRDALDERWCWLNLISKTILIVCVDNEPNSREGLKKKNSNERKLPAWKVCSWGKKKGKRLSPRNIYFLCAWN